MRTAAVASEAEKLTESIKRHRDGLMQAIGRYLGQQSQGLGRQERRTVLKVLRSSQQQLQTLEQALTGDGEGQTLKS